jgi:hypothetical protein
VSWPPCAAVAAGHAEPVWRNELLFDEFSKYTQIPWLREKQGLTRNLGSILV